jgi:hypothetical protein
VHPYWELSDAPTCLGQPAAITPRCMDPTAGTGIASASPVCVRQHMIRMLTRLQRRSVAHLCRAVAELALATRIAHLPLHPLVRHPPVRHLAALHPVVTVVGNESQTRDGLASKNWDWRSHLHLLEAPGTRLCSMLMPRRRMGPRPACRLNHRI